MENKVSPSKSGLIYGVLFGVIMVLEFVIMYIIGMESLANSSAGVIVNMANYLVLPIIFIYLGCNNFKNNINEGYISLVESLKVGISITFVAAIVYGIFNLIFNLIFSEFCFNNLSLLCFSIHSASFLDIAAIKNNLLYPTHPFRNKQFSSGDSSHLYKK